MPATYKPDTTESVHVTSHVNLIINMDSNKVRRHKSPMPGRERILRRGLIRKWSTSSQMLFVACLPHTHATTASIKRERKEMKETNIHLFWLLKQHDTCFDASLTCSSSLITKQGPSRASYPIKRSNNIKPWLFPRSKREVQFHVHIYLQIQWAARVSVFWSSLLYLIFFFVLRDYKYRVSTEEITMSSWRLVSQ